MTYQLNHIYKTLNNHNNSLHIFVIESHPFFARRYRSEIQLLSCNVSNCAIV